MTSIAFAGLGAMGGRIAGRLLAAGHRLTVWNRAVLRAVTTGPDGFAAGVAPTATAVDLSTEPAR